MFVEKYRNGVYLITAPVVDDFKCTCSVKVYNAVNKIRNSLSTIHLFNINNIEFNQKGLIVLNMLLYPAKVSLDKFKQAEKHLNHLKRNNVKINRYLD